VRAVGRDGPAVPAEQRVGHAVSAGRIYVTDFINNTERALCLDEQTGRLLWTHSWPADYGGIDYASGPRATPTVDGDRVYVQGAAGALHALSSRTGQSIWSKHAVAGYAAPVPPWGWASAPIVDGPRLIAILGGLNSAKVVAFDKLTGKELWRALSTEDSEPGYSQPVLITAAGRRQLIIWHAGAISALDPGTGRLLWEHPFRITMATPIATPVTSGPYLLVTAFFNGARLLRPSRSAAELLWRGQSNSEIKSDTLHALMAAPVIDGGYIYGICSYGQLRCLKLATGERVWETQSVTVEKARNASAHIIKHQDRYFFYNDRGELITGRLLPSGYEEISRAKVLSPTSKPGARRQLEAVTWAHPAFANRHIIARNDKEIIRLSLER